MMTKRIFFCAKIFDDERYVSDFIGGKLFANRLSYFRRLEESESSNRGDPHEAMVGWHQPSEVKVFLNDMPLTDLAGPVLIQMNWHGHLNIFCIYAAHSGDFEAITHDNLEDFKRQLRIPEECLKLGRYAVVVTNPAELIERVKAAIKREGFGLSAALVTYYDPRTFSGSISQEESAFRKRDEFQHQKEYRFSIDTGTEGVNPTILEIGDISDITVRLSTSEVNDCLRIRLPAAESA
jgi:hypothetical protein